MATMLTKNKLQFQKAYQNVNSSHEREKNRPVMANLVTPSIPNTSNYRFLWIPGKSNTSKSHLSRSINRRVSTHISNPPFGHTFNTNNSYSSIDSQRVYDDEKKTKNPPTKPFRYSRATDNSTQHIKFYTAVNIKFHESFQRNKPNISVEYKRIDVLDPLQNKNTMKKPDCHVYDKMQKSGDNDDYSLVLKDDQFPITEQYTKSVDENLTTDCIEMDNCVKKESSMVRDDTEYVNDTCENDDQFEIAVLNNQMKLEMKKIII